MLLSTFMSITSVGTDMTRESLSGWLAISGSIWILVDSVVPWPVQTKRRKMRDGWPFGVVSCLTSESRHIATSLTSYDR